MTQSSDNTTTVVVNQSQNLERLAIKLSMILAILTTAIAYYAYSHTAQATVSFWDCGEFIATSYILGVPHPPGAPLMNLIYRIAAILPLPYSVAFKINLTSALLNALGIGMLTLIITKLITRWFVRFRDWGDVAVVLSGGFVGALLAAFASTYWSNGIEAEVYGAAMFMMNLIIYLALIWSEHHGNPKSDRLLVLIAFLLYLSISIHLTVLIILPPLFLFIIFVDKDKRKSLLFWYTWIVLFSVAVEFDTFLFMTISGFVITLLGSLIFRKKNWIIAFATILMAIVGYSPTVYTLIRSRANPVIDENNPDTIAGLRSYIDRKQYGQQSLWAKMFHRRAKWANQFGTHKRMGFWGFYQTQLTRNPKKTLWGLVPFALALLGMAYQFSKRFSWGAFFFMAVLVGTVGLLIYINFADGTVPPDYLEVRDRDYFYTPGYMLLMAATGMGIAALLAMFNNFRRSVGVGSALTIILGVAFAALPAVPVRENWFSHDRSRNWIPRDYAYNILQSCAPNSVLFTNGDNDTFPLWYIQTVEGVRKDVCIANLSLINTPWYIKQLKVRTYWKYTAESNSGYKVNGEMEASTREELSACLAAKHLKLIDAKITKKSNQFGTDFIPIALTDDQISKLRAYPTKDRKIVRVQDIMVKHIISHAKVKVLPDSSTVLEPPIYFAVTVASNNKAGYDPYLKMVGLTYDLVTTEGTRQIDIDKMKNYLYNTYIYRGLNDPTVYKDENSAKLTQNYATGFMTLAMGLMDERGDTTGAMSVMDTALALLPYNSYLVMFAADVYSKGGEKGKVDKLYDIFVANDPHNAQLWGVFGYVYRRLNDNKRAVEVVDEGLSLNPDSRNMVLTAMNIYYMTKNQRKLADLINGWLAKHPDDEELKKYIRPVRKNTGAPISSSGLINPSSTGTE